MISFATIGANSRLGAQITGGASSTLHLPGALVLPPTPSSEMGHKQLRDSGRPCESTRAYQARRPQSPPGRGEEVERPFLTHTALQVSGPAGDALLTTSFVEAPADPAHVSLCRPDEDAPRPGQHGCHDWAFQRRDRVLYATRPPISAKLSTRTQRAHRFLTYVSQLRSSVVDLWWFPSCAGEGRRWEGEAMQCRTPVELRCS